MSTPIRLNFTLDGPNDLSVDEFSRYTRQMSLAEIGYAGQKKLRDASVLVVGAGGIGSSALMYVAGLGVGRIGIVDDDAVDKSNLHRQVIHSDERQGVAKVGLVD